MKIFTIKFHIYGMMCNTVCSFQPLISWLNTCASMFDTGTKQFWCLDKSSVNNFMILNISSNWIYWFIQAARELPSANLLSVSGDALSSWLWTLCLGGGGLEGVWPKGKGHRGSIGDSSEPLLWLAKYVQIKFDDRNKTLLN